MRKWGIIGAVLFAIDVALGYFLKFDGSLIIQLAVAAFAYTLIVLSAVDYGKKHNIKTWATVVIIVLAAVGGVLCCIGGMSQNIFAEISGATLALIAVIFGLVYAKKSA